MNSINNRRPSNRKSSRANQGMEQRHTLRAAIESLESRVLLTIAAPVGYGVGPSPDPYIPNAADASEVTGVFTTSGKLDIVITHTTNNSVYFLKGNGNGTFQPAVQINVGQAIQGDVFADDFNGDGHLDLFLPSANGQAIVLLGNGDGTFGPPIVSSSFNVAGPAGYYPRGWTVGKFTSNGIEDIFCGLPSNNTPNADYICLLGNGDGTFKAGIVGTAGLLEYPRWVANGDFNKDGNLDVAVADGQGASNAIGTSRMVVLLGNGDGTFRLGGDYASPQFPSGVGWQNATATANPENIVVADLTGNGILDAVVSDYSSTVNVFMGNGDGTFQPAVSYDPGNYPRNVEAVDINHDGKIDLVVNSVGINTGGAIFSQVGAFSGSVDILYGNGDGTFQQPITYSPSAFPGYTVAGDFNGDGYQDLATTEVADSNLVNVMLNVPASTNLPPTIVNPASAFPAQVTGTTTALSALGADDLGQANLTYTWATEGPVPGPVTFGANGTNAAQNSTASFTTPGTYILKCTETDPAGLTSIQLVTVSVVSTLTSIVVTPGIVNNVPANGGQQFTAVADDQFGKALAVQPAFNWITSGGGTIAATGLFTALATAGGPFTITASSGGVSGTAMVTVVGIANSGTLTFYSLPGDGAIRNFGAGAVSQSEWDTVHDAASGSDALSTSASVDAWVGTGAFTGSTPAQDGVVISRGYLAFDTSALPANAVITSATVGVYITATDDPINDGDNFVSIVQGLQASDNTLVVADYSKAGNAIDNPTEGSNRVTIPSMTVNAYAQWTLNSAGLGWITLGGITQLAAREGHDILDAWPNYTAGQNDAVNADMSETPGISMDPYLQVTYSIPALTKPSVTTNPLPQTVTAGQTASFTAAASGNPAPTVQWQISTDNGVSYSNITGATSPTYSFTSALSENGDLYEALFTNSQGSATTTPAKLTVNPVLAAPVIQTNPISQTVDVGATVTFTAAASGTPAPTVQWQISVNNGVLYTNITGATSPTYSFTAAASENGDRYQAVFTNSQNSATTSPATLTVDTAPMITANPTAQSVTAGQSATFTAAASGNPAPTVQWKVSVSNGAFTNIAGATSTTLTIPSAAAALSGNRYMAVFTNSVSTVFTTPATLTVTSAPVITTQPLAQTVPLGANATFIAAATGSPAPTVQWQVAVGSGAFTNISGATKTTLTLTAVAATLNGDRYRAVFTNSHGFTDTNAVALTVTLAPVVKTQPVAKTVNFSATATFTAAAVGSPTPTVQWQVSVAGGAFKNITGATKTTLTLTGVTAAMNANQYRAVFTNSHGTATTVAVALTVNLAPVITVQPVSKTVTHGATAVFTAAATGSPTPTVQWQVSVKGGAYTNITGATKTTLSLTKTITTMTGNKYRAIFTNSHGSFATSAATLTVK